MKFVKMEGLGNDFVVVDGPADIDPDDVAAWCDRRRGVGARPRPRRRRRAPVLRGAASLAGTRVADSGLPVRRGPARPAPHCCRCTAFSIAHTNTDVLFLSDIPTMGAVVTVKIEWCLSTDTGLLV